MPLGKTLKSMSRANLSLLLNFKPFLHTLIQWNLDLVTIHLVTNRDLVTLFLTTNFLLSKIHRFSDILTIC